MNMLKHGFLYLTVLCLVMIGNAAYAGKKQSSPGVTDREIKIGNTMAYSGPASSYSKLAKTMAAYFDMLNAEEGGINGRKINFISLDDGYSPPKTKEQIRRLVEKEKVLLIVTPFGTPTNLAVIRYLNKKKVPQLFPTGGFSTWNQSKKYPWTVGFSPGYNAEGKIYAKHVLKNHPHAKVAVLYQNDDYGRDLYDGFKKTVEAENPSMQIVAESYESTSPTVDSQIIKLKASGANVFINFTLAKFGAQAIRKIYELDWHPEHYITYAAAFISATFRPAGFEKSQGIISAAYYMDPTNPAYKNNPGIVKWRKFMSKYYPKGDQTAGLNVYGYLNAELLAHALKMCGDNLTRQNVMKQLESIRGLQLDTMIKGVKINISPTNHSPIQSVQLIQFKGEGFVPIGDIISAN
ncbi:MAG: ABC transporter substrate-binding protein [Deltaproteobacteria bacterium]|nr:ABC transporter substrate-binding protein [Deltaproteobacteria bacterium]MBT4642920.1 ABC transporter substrate-binding protein [Deltaproteobacteria bacterium]MBT6611630.1 ABC transporter substrate-binding protein [Deltaproteobacteria bacterium]